MNDPTEPARLDPGAVHSHHPEPLAPVEARVAAIESVLLIEQGLFDTEALDAIVANFEHNLGSLNGAKVVARDGSIPNIGHVSLTDGAAAYRRVGLRWPRRRPHGCALRTPPPRSQPRGVHVVLVLPVACARVTSWCIRRRHIGPGLYVSPAFFSPRWAQRSRTRLQSAWGLERRGPLPRPAATAIGNREPLRGRTRGARHPRLDDRRATTMTVSLSDDVEIMDGLARSPRYNGELRFVAPWEGRALGARSRTGRTPRPALGRVSATPHRRHQRRPGSPPLRELGSRARIARCRPRAHHTIRSRRRHTDRTLTPLTHEQAVPPSRLGSPDHMTSIPRGSARERLGSRDRGLSKTKVTSSKRNPRLGGWAHPRTRVGDARGRDSFCFIAHQPDHVCRGTDIVDEAGALPHVDRRARRRAAAAVLRRSASCSAHSSVKASRRTRAPMADGHGSPDAMS